MAWLVDFSKSALASVPLNLGGIEIELEESEIADIFSASTSAKSKVLSAMVVAIGDE